jgi:hypothetical protein
MQEPAEEAVFRALADPTRRAILDRLFVTVVHDGFEGTTATSEQVAGGMPYILSGLKTLLETGEPLAK